MSKRRRKFSISSSFSFFCWCDVASLAGFTQSVTFDGLGQDHGRLTGMLDGAFVSVVNLLRIVTAAAQVSNLLVGHVLHQLQHLGLSAEEFFAHICAALGLEILILAVHAFTHALDQKAGGVARQQIVPAMAP